MLNGQDVVVLLKIAIETNEWTIRSLEAQTSLSRPGIHRSLNRLAQAGLYNSHRRRVNLSQAEEFLVHAVKYIAPPILGGETRGIPTAWAAPELAEYLATSSAELPPVWPDPLGTQRGLSLEPLHPAAVQIAKKDPALSSCLFLVDALRLGDARVRAIAEDLLLKQLFHRGVDEH
jgi:hypothetical protein